MRSVIGIAFLALIAQAAEQTANNTAVDDDADLNEMLSNMDDETMDKVADKLIDKLLGNLTGLFNLDGQDLNNTELFKMPTDVIGNSATDDQKQLSQEDLEQIEQAAAAEAGIAAALAAAAAETAVALAAQLQDAYNNPDAFNQDAEFLPEDREETGFAPHAEDVCEGREFNQAECEAQGSGCCFWDNNACWAAVDGACPVADEATTELEQLDQDAPDLATVMFVGVASVIVGATTTYALLRPRFSIMADKQLPLLTPA
eukprot:gnl/MRDRNA2_/MRDRNA2_60749_c0_seq2.p1 gnl/MRDRNA2_/MRDRNA2_60749_c0~~gnl/MRDRNA2_/MRDRNA2_60749_c0_seq2.p1  ORF type:complete len:259 (+),score=76.32 gnl/MRDRNA2_/MRDRNA2_60749_c0_seq2:97-873(+)